MGTTLEILLTFGEDVRGSNCFYYCFLMTRFARMMYCNINLEVYSYRSGRRLNSMCVRMSSGFECKKENRFCLMGGRESILLLIFFCEVFENSIEDFVGEYRVIIIKMIISSSLSVNMKSFYCV
jgi:hypothetical protein